MGDENQKQKTRSDVQGEGDYAAGRRYNEATREFVKQEDVAEVAREAEPESAEEQRDMDRAEEQGRQRAKDEDPLLDHPEDIDRPGSK